MIETLSFIFGLGFSILVFHLSIRPAQITLLQKIGYFAISLIGITGTTWLSGVLIAHTLRKLGYLL